MKILLTGGAGYIGSHAAVVLANAGHSIVLLDNFCNSNQDVSNSINHITGQMIPCIEGDVRDGTLLSRIFEEFKTDAVIHFAGLKAVGESGEEPLKYYDNNVLGSISLLEAMKRANIKKIIFSSSATVYGQPQYLPFDEWHSLNPINTYGRTKLQVEQVMQDVAKSDSEWSIILLRYFNPVGSHESGLIGENPNGIPNNLMPYVMQVASGKLPYLKIFGDDYETRDGTGERDFIHIMDLVEGHLAALNYLEKNIGCEVFNLGSGTPISVLDIVRTYEKISGAKIPVKTVPRRDGDLPIYYSKADKARQLLNWGVKRGVAEMCHSSFKWQEHLEEKLRQGRD